MKRRSKIILSLFALGCIFQGCETMNVDPETETNDGVGSKSVTITPSLENDSLALVALYNATNGPEWPLSNHWLKAPIRKWFGVKTEKINGERRVTALRLPNMKLKGQLPSEIRNLTELKTLDLCYNKDLKGSIIEEVYELKNLICLNLRFTSLTGTLSSSIGQLTSLDTLDLWTSPWEQDSTTWGPNPYILTGSIPKELGNLKQARFIRLGRQGFTGELPEEMGNMTSLNFLDVANCKLTGGVPASFGQLKNLEIFFAADNQLDKAIPEELCGAVNLRELYLNQNQIPGEIPACIGDLTRLTDLDCSENQLTGSIPASLNKIKTLGLLYLNDNQLEGCIPEDICTSHPMLIRADLSNNNLTGSVPDNLPKYLQNAGYWYACLLAHGNKLTGSLPEVYLQFDSAREFFLPQQEGYGFNNFE